MCSNHVHGKLVIKIGPLMLIRFILNELYYILIECSHIRSFPFQPGMNTSAVNQNVNAFLAHD